MEYRDYYKILGLARTATADEIKKTYRRLARKFHPDVSKETNAAARFKQVQEAYEVLKDPEKRAAYDQLGRDWRAGQEFRPPPGWDEGYEFSGRSFERGGGFSDFFESLFGGLDPRRQRGEATSRSEAVFRARGGDHHARILIDLRDAFTGATRQVSLHAPQVDDTGHVALSDRLLNVQIPKGITEGQHVRLKGQGAPGIGGAPAGDLYLEVAFKPDRLYRTDAHDLYLDLPVAPWEAALGASVRMPTPEGPIMVRVPPGSAQGRKLRVRGRGIPGAEPGDLYAVLKIVLPPADTDEARKVYEEMARKLPFDPRAGLGE
jgi:curved DNA-binding protein